MTGSTYDFVVVGGGPGGCIVASRLSENPAVRVLLLEAGGSEIRRDVETPEAWPMMLGSDADWGTETAVQDLLARRVPAPRGRLLGGSGSINAMAHLRGHRQDYDRWASLGAPGWGWTDVLPFHMATEDVPDRDPGLRGRGGPLRPQPIAKPHPLSVAHVEAAAAAGFPRADDLNDGELRGTGLHDLLIDDENRRQSAATAYLRPAMGRENLTVVTGALVGRLIFDGLRCRGVHFTVDGRREKAFSLRETVLCAGAVGTTSLLLKSGIGPESDLKRLNVPVVVDSPEVGANLQDHVLLCGVRVRVDRPLDPPSGNLAEATLLSTFSGAPGRPDVQICNVQLDYHTAVQQPAGDAFTLGIGLMRPESRGRITLDSTDDSAAPIIDPRYLSESTDRAAAASALEIAARLAATGAFDEWGGRCDADDWLSCDDAELQRRVADGVGSYYHLSGTARMGSDDTAVVDPTLRVNGVENLRVADASVMPEIVSCNTQAAVMMIGEKAASLLSTR